jgi:rsbT co-antagonist protein RsbR
MEQSERMQQIAARLHAMASGDAPPPIATIGEDDLGEVERALNRAIASLDGLLEERLLFSVGPVVVFRWRATEGWPVEYVSPNVADLTGYPLSDILSGARPYASLIHPDDLAHVTDEVSTNSARGAAWFVHDAYRLQRSDGQCIWVSDYTVIRRDATGAITHYFGYIADITESMEQARALARSEEVLRQVSTPILQVWDGVLAMPVLGAVDAPRAAQMMDTLLGEVARGSSTVAILDLTGLEDIDSATMDHLMCMVRAVSLLGCTCLLSGISPGVARLIVNLGIPAADLRTFGTLRGALAHALSARHASFAPEALRKKARVASGAR